MSKVCLRSVSVGDVSNMIVQRGVYVVFHRTTCTFFFVDKISIRANGSTMLNTFQALPHPNGIFNAPSSHLGL
jgi:hypothetical protein